MKSRIDGTGSTWGKLVLLVGFLAMFGALVAAYTSPATVYELSIYAGTPLAFWVGIAVAFTASLVVGLAGNRADSVLALILGGQATAAVVGLPILRNYRYYGAADAMTHLGWARDLVTGSTAPPDLFYPGIHTVTSFVSVTTGLALERSMLLTVFVVSLVGMAFVPLTVRAITGSWEAAVVGAFAGFLLLPVNAISTHLHAHAFTQATLFSAALLFLFVRYVGQPTDPGRSFDPTTVGALLAIVGVATVLYHPQQAANVIVAFVAISLVQLLARWRMPNHPVGQQRTMYAQTGVLVAVFVAWTGRFETTRVAVGRIGGVVVGYLTGNPPQAAESVQNQGASLAAIGSGLPEIFLKLFLVSSVFCLLAGLLVLASLLGRLDDTTPDRNAIVTYLAVGLASMAPVFLVYTLGGISEQYFRHLGFIMLLVTVLGALAIHRGRSRLPLGRPSSSAVLATGFAVMLALSLVAVFPSPYLYQPTEHVTDQQLTGYESAFETQSEDVPLLSIRGSVWRYSDGIHGVDQRREYLLSLPDGGLANLTTVEEEPFNLAVSQYDRDREIHAYQELRFSEQSFESLDANAGVNRVRTNGDLDIYHVRPAPSEDVDGPSVT